MNQGKKRSATFLCRSCGNDFPKWFGQCPQCGEWNTIVPYRPPSQAPRGGGTRRGPREESLGPPARSGASGAGRGWATPPRDPGYDAGVRLLADVSSQGPQRIPTGLSEFDRVLGGGIVPGSVVLIGGDPGIGKSTLLLQVASRLIEQKLGVLYVSGEESAAQVKLRATRLASSPRLAVLAEGDLERVLEAVSEGIPSRARADSAADGDSVSRARSAPRGSAADAGAALPAEEPRDAGGSRPVDVLFVDSIQSSYLPDLPSAPGSVLQVRECALQLTQMAKRRGVAVFLVGHVTKEGNLAGPRTLEHIVDAVLTMEGERFHAHRLLRSVKNRFGGVHEIGVFDMQADGLQEVTNPSRLFLGEEAGLASGSAVVAAMEGSRPLLIEVQALVHATRYGIPQRIATGFEGRRLAILLAVLSKRGSIDLSSSDVFVNVAGGLRIDEPGVDLGVLLAIAASATDRPAGQDLAAFGEIGLGGEVRRVSDPERRIAEAVRLGFRRLLLPAATARDLRTRGWHPPGDCRLFPVVTLQEALQTAWSANERPS
ncbi:MAG: DNA repair protein RadA [Candidatus Eisenbacteria bacterium]